MANFFEEQRGKLGLSRIQMAARIDATAESVRLWEYERQWPARVSIARLAQGYGVSEKRMAEEVMVLRRRIEDRKTAVTTKG